MKNTNTGGNSNWPVDNSQQNPPKHPPSYPNSDHYMKPRTCPLKVKTNYWGQAFILTIAVVTCISISFLFSAAYGMFFGADNLEPTNNLSVSETEVDREYPEIDQNVKDLANRLGLTEKAKKLFYDYEPEIFESRSHPNFLCDKDIKVSWRITISGCWSGKTKKIYLINDKKLETTAAHEFLHAVYYDLFLNGEHEEINKHLTETYNQNVEELKKFIDIYDDLSENEGGSEEFKDLNKYNELHSFIGSQIEDMPIELEDHYAEYFKDRRVVVSFYEQANSNP